MFPAIVLFSLTPFAEAPKEKEFSVESKKELKQLEGKWKMVKVIDPDKESELKDGEIHFIFKDVQITFAVGEKSETLAIKSIDTGTDPKCIDLTEKRNGKPDRILEGVYKIDGDTLLIALSLPKEGKNRPAGFDKPTERGWVWVFKRVKE